MLDPVCLAYAAFLNTGIFFVGELGWEITTTWTCSIEIVNFGGRILSIPTCSHYLERTYFQPFSTIILINVLCVFSHGTWVYNVLSPDTFSYIFYIRIVSTDFLKRVWGSLPDYLMNIFINERMCNFS